MRTFPRMERWRVSFPTDPPHLDALLAALALEVPREQTDWVTGGGDDEPWANVAFVVPATNAEAALAAAQELVARAIQDTDLPSSLIPEPATASLISPVAALPLEDQLSIEASRLVMEGRNDMAVLRAQAACEVYARKVLDDLLERRGGSELVKHVKPSATLNDRRSQGLFHLLTNEWITHQEWWDAYREHLERRNNIVHAGAVVTSDQAHASLDAADGFRRYLNAAWGRARDVDLERP
jgi:hypothetical protein